MCVINYSKCVRFTREYRFRRHRFGFLCPLEVQLCHEPHDGHDAASMGGSCPSPELAQGLSWFFLAERLSAQ